MVRGWAGTTVFFHADTIKSSKHPRIIISCGYHAKVIFWGFFTENGQLRVSNEMISWEMFERRSNIIIVLHRRKKQIETLTKRKKQKHICMHDHIQIRMVQSLARIGRRGERGKKLPLICINARVRSLRWSCDGRTSATSPEIKQIEGRQIDS